LVPPHQFSQGELARQQKPFEDKDDGISYSRW